MGVGWRPIYDFSSVVKDFLGLLIGAGEKMFKLNDGDEIVAVTVTAFKWVDCPKCDHFVERKAGDPNPWTPKRFVLGWLVNSVGCYATNGGDLRKTPIPFGSRQDHYVPHSFFNRKWHRCAVGDKVKGLFNGKWYGATVRKLPDPKHPVPSKRLMWQLKWDDGKSGWVVGQNLRWLKARRRLCATVTECPTVSHRRVLQKVRGY